MILLRSILDDVALSPLMIISTCWNTSLMSFERMSLSIDAMAW